MFTPSLISMVLHSFWSDFNIITDALDLDHPREVADLLADWSSRRQLRVWPQVPVLARTSDLNRAREHFKECVQFDEVPEFSGSLVWGRVPIDRLIKYYSSYCDLPEDDEVFDLGTTLTDAAEGDDSLTEQCEKWLKQTNLNSPNVHICIIDRGKDSSHGPNDFGGYLTHAERSGVDMTDHATQVLYALLERLDHYKILPECKLYCSLVKPPAKPIGKKCFDHANSVELVTALKKVRGVLSWSLSPVLFNLSMGTHAGPHNGASPLEMYANRQASPSQGRYFFASAGNDGLKGVANRAFLEPNTQESFLLRTGSRQTAELLLEFWWRQPPQGTVEFEVQIYEYDPEKMAFSRQFTSTLKISSSKSGVVLAQQPQSFKNVVCASLFHSRCYKDLSCAALAVSTIGNPGLPIIDIEVTVRSTHQRAIVNGWVVVSDDPETAFIAGNKSGSLTLPASDLEILSVAGVGRTLQPWGRSSRGPASIYTDYAVMPPGPSPQQTPWLAHRVELGALGAVGTSFASPRACADAANIVRAAPRRKQCNSIPNLVAELLRIPRANLSWTGRWGCGRLS
jgi:hypothetical protein